MNAKIADGILSQVHHPSMLRVGRAQTLTTPRPTSVPDRPSLSSAASSVTFPALFAENCLLPAHTGRSQQSGVSRTRSAEFWSPTSTPPPPLFIFLLNPKNLHMILSYMESIPSGNFLPKTQKSGFADNSQSSAVNLRRSAGDRLPTGKDTDFSNKHERLAVSTIKSAPMRTSIARN